MRAAGRPNGGVRTPRAISARSETTAEAVAMPPAPGPTSVIGASPSASTVTALVDAHDLGDGGLLRHHGRMHALLDAGFGFHRHAQKLHPVAKLVRGIEVGERDGGDAFDIDRSGIELGAEGEARQDRQLLRGVVAFDIERRIGLRIAEPLRLAQAIRESEPILLHAREDVIAGAVEDAVDARKSVAV